MGVRYDDGYTELCVKYDRMVRRGGASNPESAQLTTGTRIEVNWRGHGQYYPATVCCYRASDDTYKIYYDDTESEDGVATQFVRVTSATFTLEPNRCPTAHEALPNTPYCG